MEGIMSSISGQSTLKARKDMNHVLSYLTPTSLEIPVRRPHNLVYGVKSQSKNVDFDEGEIKVFTSDRSLLESKLQEKNNEVKVTSTIYDKPQTTVFDKHRTTTTTSAMSFNLESESYLPIESDHVQAVLHQCDSYGVQFPINKKTSQLKWLLGESQGGVDPLLEKALLLTTIYDNHNMEALTKNHITHSRQEVTETVHMAPESVQDSVAQRTTSRLDPQSASRCDSNCKCKERLEILARMQNSVLHQSYNRVSNTGSQIPGCVPIHGKEFTEVEDKCVKIEKDSKSVEKGESCLVLEDDGVDRCGTTSLKSPNNKSNIKNNAVITKDTNGSNSTNQEKSPDDYLPLDNCQLEAILEHGQAFGIQFPIQTKLRIKFEGPFERSKMKQRIQKRLNRHCLLNRPQTKDVENGFHSKLATQNQDSKRQHCTCYNCRQVNNDPVTHGRIMDATPVQVLRSPPSPFNFMATSYTPSELQTKNMHQHEIRSKNRGDEITSKGGSGDVSNLVHLARAKNNEGYVGNTGLSSLSTSQVIMELLKQRGGGEVLHAFLSRSGTLPSRPENRTNKRLFSVTSGNINKE